MDIATPAIQANKRRKFVGEITKMNMDYGNPAPAGYRPVTYHKRYGKGYRRKGLMATLKQQVKDNQMDLICRWQSVLTPQPRAASLLSRPFGQRTDGTILYMPCYAFNLSDIGYNVAQTFQGTPMYRLEKDTTAGGTAQGWDWTDITGTKNNADGVTDSKHWQLEHQEGSLGLTDRYRHDWSHIRILFQGMTKYPCRFHVYRVRFFNKCGPQRVGYNYSGGGGVVTIDQPPDSTQYNENDYFWERFMFPKVVHPFANTKKTGLTDRKHLKVLSHEVINVGSEVTISSDVQPLQHIHNMFVRNGKVYSLMEAKDVEAKFMPQAGAQAGIRGDGKAGFSNVQENQAIQSAPVDESAPEWLLIVAEAYQVTGTGMPEVSQDVTNTPSFDISVRSKFTVYNKV